MQGGTTLEAVLRRDRRIVLGALASIATLAWTYMGYLAWKMEPMDRVMELAMPRMQVWDVVDLCSGWDRARARGLRPAA